MEFMLKRGKAELESVLIGTDKDCVKELVRSIKEKMEIQSLIEE